MTNGQLVNDSSDFPFCCVDKSYVAFNKTLVSLESIEVQGVVAKLH